MRDEASLRVGVAALLLAAALQAQPKADKAATEMVNAKDLEKALASGNERLSNPDWLNRIEKKEYPFLEKYLHAPSPDVRTALTSLLLHINAPFCQKFYTELVRDSMFSVRVLAARGLVKLDRKVKKEPVLAEYQRLGAQQGDDRNALLGFFVLALGNTGDRKIQDTLAAHARGEHDPGLHAIYQKTLARSGHAESLREIEAELALPGPRQRILALEKVAYLLDSSWTPKVRPLLLDSQLVDSIGFMNRGVSLRVCDYAVNTLSAINPGKPFPFDVGGRAVYDAGQLRQARELYGLAAIPAAASVPKAKSK